MFVKEEIYFIILKSNYNEKKTITKKKNYIKLNVYLIKLMIT